MLSIEQLKTLQVYEPWWPRQTRRLGLWSWTRLLQKRCRLTAAGQEHLQGLTAAIFAPNHTSHLDAWAVLAALPRAWQTRTYVASAEYFGRGFWRRLYSRWFAYHNFIFDRKTVTPGTFDRLVNLVQAGCGLVFFPQGTRGRGGQVPEYRPLAAMLALSAQVPVVPVAISGSAVCLPPGSTWPRAGRIHVQFGPPLASQEFLPAAGKPLHPAARRLTERLRQAVEGLAALSKQP